MAGQPDPSYVGSTTAPRVVGRDRRDAPAFQAADVHVELTGEQHSLAPHVHLLVSRGRRMPDPARQLTVRSVHEPIALLFRPDK
jgi:hypothetical protein